MAYGTTKVDVIQSSTANVPVQFNDGNGTQVGTLCRAWVNFNGTGTVAIRSSFNVSSITDDGTGLYTVNFTNAMPDTNYAVSGTATAQTTSSSGMRVCSTRQGTTGYNPFSTSSVALSVTYANGNVDDAAFVTAAIFR